jgi:hypothetical protein
MRRIYDWNAIQRYYDKGNGFVACRRRYGCTHAAWMKAIKLGELIVKPTPFRDYRRRHDWGAIQAYYDEGNSVRACIKRFGFCTSAWMKARDRGEVRSRNLVMPISRLLEAPWRGRRHIKTRLLNAGLLTNKCEGCGLAEWRGQPITMHLDHVNGVRNDHRLANLRMLCPNCHSQTETYGGRNARRRRQLQEQRVVM